ncbi:MAG: hypothetical protein ACOYLK_13210 [Sphingomonas sp.]
MTKDELKTWLLDTISEGGYSFKEISEYVARHGVNIDDLSSALRSIFDARFIDVELRQANDDCVSLDAIEGGQCLANMSLIIAEESDSRSAHYLKITSDGRAALDEMEIN